MYEKQLREKLATLTIQEKIGQLIQLSGDFFQGSIETIITGPQKKLGLSENYNLNHTGSILNVTNKAKIMEIQKNYLKNSTHKIPLLFMADIIYGYKTIFPIPLAQACSWNFPLIEESASILAKECYEEGLHVTFSPMVDVVRDPRWGRVMESPGEDTYLAELYAKSMVRGIQGPIEKDEISSEKIAACVKHFAAYGAPVAGREYNMVDMSEHTLREYYLPSYKAAIQAGVKLVMTAFNTLNGIPATGNKWLNREILRNEFGFKGALISDYAALEELIAHGYAKDEQMAAKLALQAGVDIDMKTAIYTNQLSQLVENNPDLLQLLDEATYRILALKNDLGLFEDPYRGIDLNIADNSCILSQPHKQKALELAEESVVLLKNNKAVLPLDKRKKIAVIGPYTNEGSTLGMWAVTGDEGDTITLKQALSLVMDEEHLSTCRGSYMLDKGTNDLYDKYAEKLPIETVSEEDLMEEAIRQAEVADVIVLALGESVYQSGEGGSRTNPTLPNPQAKLLNELSLLNKPIVLVVYAGRPLILTDVEKKVDAILYAWYPGTMNGTAIANILLGTTNPSGKLTMTFPRSVGQIPIYYNELRTGRPQISNKSVYRFSSRYIDEQNAALFPFGYGKSYTEFKYDNLVLDKKEMKSGEQLTAKVTIKNVGKRAGKEIVQLYLCDQFASVARPSKVLKDFRKLHLNSGEILVLTFIITEEMLNFHNQSGEYTNETGEFTLFVGKDSEDHSLQETFSFIKGNLT